MANEDTIRFRGSGKEYKDDRGGATLIPSAVLGIVKNNIDPTRSGRIEVFLKRLGATDPDNSAYWTTVRYLSPFFGNTPNTGNPQAHGDYVGNPNSYGFWATPPDIGTEVICVFLNGDPNEGYYIGSIPQPGMTHMTPGIAASDSIIPNSGEAQSYGGATRLPVSEINNANSKQSNNPSLTAQPRPIHSYQAAIYNKQGLLRDPDRGPVSSSSTRESPSRVFGMSTPGRPIYQGGYDDTSIKTAIKDTSIPDKNFEVIGRRGGHTFVMDDGDMSGKDQLIRFRSATGHTILMSDSAQTLFIIHANGQSYIELGSEGTIDMYASNSVNIRTQGDLNLHADRNINMHAAKDLNINAENIQVESEKQTNMFTGTNFAQHVKGNFTTKVDSGMSMASAGEASFASSAATYINGSKVNLNTGSSGLQPQSVKQVPKVKHTDTLYDSKVGFAAAPGKLTSITSRAPAHAPWGDANKGVDVKTNLSAGANFPSAASPVVSSVNTAAGATPPTPTTPTLVASVPNAGVSTGTQTLSPQQTNAVVSSMAVNAANNTVTADAVKQTAATVTPPNSDTPVAVLGAFAATPNQLAAAGNIKPGTEVAINAAIAAGTPIHEAIPDSAWTGKGGVNSTSDFLNNQNAQIEASKSLIQKSEQALVDKGVLTGKESGNQSAGLIAATASAGVGPVTDFIKSSASSVSSMASQATGAISSIASKATGGLGLSSIDDIAKKAGLGLKLPANASLSSITQSVTSALPMGALNSVSGQVGALIAGGNLAAGLADKVMGGITAPSGVPTPEGVSKGLFDKIVSGFKPLQGGVPQNLTAINEKNKAEQEGADSAPTTSAPASLGSLASAASKVTGDLTGSLKMPSIAAVASAAGLGGAMNTATSMLNTAKTLGDKLGSSVPTVDTTGLGNLPGGAQGLSNLVKGDLPQSIPGTDKLASAVASIKTGAVGALDTVSNTVSGLKDKMNGASLASFASLGLPAKDLAALQGAMNSISAGGAAEIKLPTLAEGTNNTDELAAQSKNLLGNAKIPALNFGPMKSVDTSDMLALSKARRAAADDVKSKREAYEASLQKTGNRLDPETSSLFAQLQTAIDDMDKLG